MIKPTWISEKEASEKMNKHPRYFRSLVKTGTLPISYRHDDKGRNWEYDLKAIEKIKSRNETIIYC
jgi:hypothetical protein